MKVFQVIIGKSLKSIFIKGAGAVLALVTTAILARVLGSEEFGQYTYVLAVLAMLAIPIHLGLPQLLVREFARGAQTCDRKFLEETWSWSTKIVFKVGALIALIIFTASWVYIEDSSLRLCLMLGALLPLLSGFVLIRSAMLRGLGEFYIALGLDGVVRPLIIIIIVIVVVIFKPFHIGAETTLLINMLATSICMVIGYIVLKRAIAEIPDLKSSKSGYRLNSTIKNSLIPLSLIAGFRVINSNFDVFMLGVLSNSESVGLYKAMIVLSAALLIPAEAINSYIAPKLTKGSDKSQRVIIEKFLIATTWLSFGLAMFGFIILVTYQNEIVSYIYSDDFIKSSNLILVLGIGQLIHVLLGPVALILNMNGFEKLTLKSLIIALLVNVIFNILLIPKYGAFGAAVATFCSTILWNIIAWHYVRTRLEIDPSIFNFSIFNRKT